MDNPPSRSTGPAAGGCLLASGIMAGAIYGAVAGDATLAVLIGAAAGLVAAVMIFVIDRRR